MAELKIAKSYKIARKYFDKIKDGTKEYEFRVNEPDLEIYEGDILEFVCGKEKIYAKIESIDTNSHNIADAIYGSLLWGNQYCSDSRFETAMETYTDLKKYYGDRLDEIKKYGIIVYGIAVIKDYEE